MGEQKESWDRLIIYIMSNKFDLVTRRDWESYRYCGDLPTMEDLNLFLKNKCEMLEKLEISQINREQSIVHSKEIRSRRHSNNFSVTNLNQNNSKFKCYYCKQDHSIFKCESFLKLKVNDRIAAVKQLKLCLNCIRDSHPDGCESP